MSCVVPICTFAVYVGASVLRVYNLRSIVLLRSLYA